MSMLRTGAPRATALVFALLAPFACHRTDARTEPASADPGKAASSGGATAGASASTDAGDLAGFGGIGHGPGKPALCSNGSLVDDSPGFAAGSAQDAGLGSAASTSAGAAAAPSASALSATAKRHLFLFGRMRSDTASPETNALAAKVCAAFPDLRTCARAATLPYGQQKNELSIDLAPDGKVTHVGWKPSAAPFDVGFAGCLERTISALVFDADAKGGARSFGYGLEVTVSRDLEAQLTEVSPTVTGALPAGVVEQAVRARFGLLRKCYESARKRDAGLEGTVTTAFVIDASGAATKVHTTAGTLTDAAMLACVHDVFANQGFPAPAKGTVTVTMPISFTME